MSTSRRHFLQQAGAVALGFSGLHTFIRTDWATSFGKTRRIDPFGPLKKDPNGVFDLPEGFTYRIISKQGTRMDDGFFVPHRPDGMAAFLGPQSDLTVLVRNHEISVGSSAAASAFHAKPELLDRISDSKTYDRMSNGHPCPGGTTTLVYNTQDQRVECEFLSLVGTARNCAGGPTPWKTWITCEETVRRAGEGCGADHGYAFEVPATATPELAAPVPLRAMGRFNHEAVAVDPDSGIVYQTEDRDDGLIYRFIPNVPGALYEGGQLQALAVSDQPSLDMRNWAGRTIPTGTPLAVRWLDLDDVHAPDDDLRYRGFATGAARFARGEGMWYGQSAVYFACTNAGPIKKGHICKYTPSPYEGTARESDVPGTVEIFVEPNDPGLIDNADNLTVSPWGDVIVCEDGSGQQYLVGTTSEGAIYRLGMNAMANNSELAGASFAPDGSTLFLNIQDVGYTLAIVGPWSRAARG